jgi:hypothetical protein
MSELISPELALVDPELAARARAALPDPGTLHLSSPVFSRPLRLAPLAAVSHAPTAVQRTPRSRRSRLAPVALVVAAIVCTSPVVVWQSRTGSSTASPVLRSVAPAEPARPSGTTFTWPRIKNAEAYRLDVRHAADVVFTIRTPTTRAALPINPTLPRGTYSWRVAPVFNLKTVASVGAPIVEGVFTVGQ